MPMKVSQFCYTQNDYFSQHYKAYAGYTCAYHTHATVDVFGITIYKRTFRQSPALLESYFFCCFGRRLKNRARQ